MFAWCSTMGQAEADNATESILETARSWLETGLKKLWKLKRPGQGEACGLLSLRLSGLPADLNLSPFPNPSTVLEANGHLGPHSSAELLGCAWPRLAAAVWMRMAP